MDEDEVSQIPRILRKEEINGRIRIDYCFLYFNRNKVAVNIVHPRKSIGLSVSITGRVRRWYTKVKNPHT